MTERLEALTISREDMLSLQTRGYYSERGDDVERRSSGLDGRGTSTPFASERSCTERGSHQRRRREHGDQASGWVRTVTSVSAAFDGLASPSRPANTAFEGKEESA
jgi:hypothetical protein